MSNDHTRLAGLDNLIVVHFPGTNDAPKPGIKNKRRPSPKKATTGVRPASRRPLTEKTVDLNLRHAPLVTKSRNIVHRDSHSRDPATGSTSLHVLPRIPSPSSFQLESLVNVLQIPPAPPVQLCEPTPPPTPLSSHTLAESHISAPFSPHHSVFSAETHEPQDENQHIEDPYTIRAFQHPNSPYVPWAHHQRREILRPMSPTSGYSSPYSQAASRCYSRSGARAPEPESTASLVKGGRPRMAKTKSWKNTVRAKVRLNVKNVTKRLSFFNKRKAASVRAHSLSPNSSFSSYDGCSVAQSSFVDVSYGDCSSPRPRTESSKETSNASLNAWLYARQKILMEREYEPESMQTVDEYERMGSWLNGISGAPSPSCGVPGCQLQYTPGSSRCRSGFLTSIPCMPTHSQWCEETKENMLPRIDSLPEMAMTATMPSALSRGGHGQMSVPNGLWY